jgi:hypothetical protein
MQAFVVVATIGTLFLLASSLPVKANGAWLLWQGSQKLNKAEGVEKYLINEANINWILLSGHDTKSTCVKFALDPWNKTRQLLQEDKAIEIVEEDLLHGGLSSIRARDKNKNEVLFLFTCLPDTIDPRRRIITP